MPWPVMGVVLFLCPRLQHGLNSSKGRPSLSERDKIDVSVCSVLLTVSDGHSKSAFVIQP